MAQSKAASTSTKLFFEFLPEDGGTSGTYFIDIAQCMSMTQRKSFRQGMNYAVENMSFKYAPTAAPQPGVFTSIEVSSIPKTWVADNSTTRAYLAWMEQRREVLKEQPSLKSAWSDFKLFLDSDHVQAGFASNLLPHSAITNSCGKTGKAYLAGDWEASELVFPVDGGAGGTGAANQQTMHVVGNNLPPGNFTVAGTSFSLIEAYANSRRTPQSPDPSTTGVSTTTNPYATLSAPDSTYQDIAENLLDNNNEPPYDLDDYPGGELNAPSAELVKKMYPTNFGSTTNGITQISYSNTGPFIAPFGLIKIETCGLSSSFDYMILEVDLVPGNYKGLLAERGV